MSCSIRVCLLLTLAPAQLLAATPSIFIAEDATHELSDRLRVELPQATFADDRVSADIAVTLSAERRLAIIDRDGTVIVDRVLSGGREAVVRAAALLVFEAARAWEPPRAHDDPSPEDQPPVDPLSNDQPPADPEPGDPKLEDPKREDAKREDPKSEAPPERERPVVERTELATTPPWKFGAAGGVGLTWR